MKDLYTLVTIAILMVVTPSNVLGQQESGLQFWFSHEPQEGSREYEEDCSKLQFWTTYTSPTTAYPPLPYSAVLITDTAATTTPLSLWSRFGYVGNWNPEELQNGWGYGTFFPVVPPGNSATDVSEHVPTDTLEAGETLYFRKIVTGATNTTGLGGGSHTCRYLGEMWSYTVPDITTGVGPHGLPVGINLRFEGLTVSLSASDSTPQSFWIFDTRGSLIREGLMSADVNIRMPRAGVYILWTKHGSKQFFVSD